MAHYFARFFLFVWYVCVGTVTLLFAVTRWVVVAVVSVFLALFTFGLVSSAVRKEQKERKQRAQEYVDALVREAKEEKKQDN